MSKVREWLQGKKSYVMIALGVIVGILRTYAGVEIPEFVWVAIASLLGITYKAGQNRTEKKVEEFLKEIKEAGIEGRELYEELKAELDAKHNKKK